MLTFKAIVIGAGPAGITTVANLLQFGIQPILWVDPEFKVGRLNSYYNIPANTQNKYFYQYFEHLCLYNNEENKFTRYWDKFDKEDTSRLLYVVDALKETMQFLIRNENVAKVKKHVKTIEYLDGKYHIDSQYEVEYVFICTGSQPIKNNIHNPATQQVVSFDALMNDDYMDIDKNDKFAIFGNSHSAMLGLMNLFKYTNNIVNFYKSEIKYAVFYDDWILYDNTGLKGDVAEWTKTNINRFKSVQINDPSFNEIFKSCNKILYAVGFQRNELPEIIINGVKIDTSTLKYNEESGQIFEKLYGFGIAFPEIVVDRLGNKESSVGVWKFMKHINHVISKLAQKEMSLIMIEEVVSKLIMQVSKEKEFQDNNTIQS